MLAQFRPRSWLQVEITVYITNISHPFFRTEFHPERACTRIVVRAAHPPNCCIPV